MNEESVMKQDECQEYVRVHLLVEMEYWKRENDVMMEIPVMATDVAHYVW